MKKLLSIIFAALLLCGTSVSLFARDASSVVYIEACNAFSRGEWESAELLLRKALAYSQNNNADTNYLLITAEIYADDNISALKHTEAFLRNYPDSIYIPRVQFMRGKLLYSLGDYEKAIIVLSDFCHQYESNELYPSALFYIAESLYEGYKYDEAESIYERILIQYPDSNKGSAAKFRIESIAQRSREEKLLYLLKQNGEEYLAAKEDYERQLRLYNSEAIDTTRDRLIDSQRKTQELEEQIRDLENQLADLKGEQLSYSDEKQIVIFAEKKENVFTETSPTDEDLKILKQKAKYVQWLIDEAIYNPQ